MRVDLVSSPPDAATRITPSASRSSTAVNRPTAGAALTAVACSVTPLKWETTDTVTAVDGTKGLPNWSSAATSTWNGSPATTPVGTEVKRSVETRGDTSPLPPSEGGGAWTVGPASVRGCVAGPPPHATQI